MGDLLGFWFGKWITFAVRHLAKMVPAYELPLTNGRKVVSLQEGPGNGRAAHPRAQHRHARFDCLFAIHRRHHGLSKGAVLTHRNIVAATLQAEAWFTPPWPRLAM